MIRNVKAVSGPPITAPITTSSPVSVASRIVVRMVAPKVDCLVVVIAFAPRWFELERVLPPTAKSPMGAIPYFPLLCCPGGLGASTLAGCDQGGSADHRGDRRPGRPRGGTRSRTGRPAAPLRPDRGPDRG